MKRFSLLLIIAAMTLAAVGQAQNLEGLALSSAQSVYTFGDMSEAGWSKVVRTRTGISMNFHSTNLDPGSVYTVWWVIFNNPGACSPDPMGEAAIPVCGEDDIFNADGERDPNVLARISVVWATGNIVGDAGELNVSAALDEGQPTVFVGFGPGLETASMAEVHLVVRAHGPMDPATLWNQLNTPEADGVDVQFAIHLPPAG